MDDVTDAYPSYERDLFSPEALRHPFEHYRRIRDLGPVVRLPSLNVLALSRFEDVQAALRTPEVFSSAEGIAFNDVFNTPGPEPDVIASDGERHQRLRLHLARPLALGALKPYRDMLKSMIVEQIVAAADGEEFDGVERIAKYLPLAAISYLVGLPEQDRQNMLRWATAVFNMVGPLASGFEADLAILGEFRQYLWSVDPAHLEKDSWAGKLFEAVDRGEITQSEARATLGGLVAPSLDTTINAKSCLLYNLGAQPAQWKILKENPSLTPSAVLEAVRHSATVRWFARYTASDYSRNELFIPKGERIMVMYASANRDERRYADPDEFQVARKPTDQLGWGTGPHICVGMHLAKMEMEVMLEALIENVDRIEVGEPVVGCNRGLYGFDRLPMRMIPLR